MHIHLLDSLWKNKGINRSTLQVNNVVGGKNNSADYIHDNQAFKVKLSEEGKRLSRDKLAVVDKSNDKTTESINNRIENINTQINPAFYFGGIFESNIAKKRDELGSISLQEKCESIFSTYKDLYDDVVKKHESGQDGPVIFDETQENHCRKMTMKEELDVLDELYQQQVDKLEREKERWVKEQPIYMKIFEDLKRLAALSRRTPKMIDAAKANIDEKIPQNITLSMYTAKGKFIDIYWQKGMQVSNSSDLIKKISVF